MAPGLDVGDDDFNAMFDVLDLTNRGYLTAEEIQKIYQELFYKPVNVALVSLLFRRLNIGLPLAMVATV